MKKILFIVNNLIIGGVEKVCWEIVTNIDRNRYQCDFLVACNPDEIHYYEEKLKNVGCNIYKSLKIYSAKDKKIFLEIEKNLLKKNNYDIVHSHVDFLNIWTLKVAKSVSVRKCISHVHTICLQNQKSKIREKMKHWIQVKLLSYYSDTRLACSKQAAADYYGKAAAEIIFNGFDIHHFLDLDITQKEDYNLITVGRIVDQKNPQFVVEIMRELVHLDPSYKLYWIGDGVLKKEIEHKISMYGLQESIVLLGATTEIDSTLQKCRVAIYPSKNEGLGISIVEAQLAHCFTFFSDIVPEEAYLNYGKSLPLGWSAKQWAQEIHSGIRNRVFESYQIDQNKSRLYDVKFMTKKMNRIYDEKNNF